MRVSFAALRLTVRSFPCICTVSVGVVRIYSEIRKQFSGATTQQRVCLLPRPTMMTYYFAGAWAAGWPPSCWPRNTARLQQDQRLQRKHTQGYRNNNDGDSDPLHCVTPGNNIYMNSILSILSPFSGQERRSRTHITMTCKTEPTDY